MQSWSADLWPKILQEPEPRAGDDAHRGGNKVLIAFYNFHTPSTPDGRTQHHREAIGSRTGNQVLPGGGVETGLFALRHCPQGTLRQLNSEGEDLATVKFAFLQHDPSFPPPINLRYDYTM